MPIKPENRKRYPPEWKQIRERILRRAGYACEECRAANGSIGYRDDGGAFIEIARASDGGTPEDFAGHATGYRVFRIVLTVAHLDHTPEHCEPENLRAWCQRCHLAYDAEHHARNSSATRRARKALGELPL
jgi:5-methylcytosine-specific restriction endonuclease McrA